MVVAPKIPVTPGPSAIRREAVNEFDNWQDKQISEAKKRSTMVLDRSKPTTTNML